jgi:hypothetical protein
MKKILFAGAVLAMTAAAAGCSSSTQDPGVVNNNNNNNNVCDAKSGVDKSTCYPTTDVGYTARKGSVAGNRIQNYKFIGYGTDASAAKVDTSKGTGTVQLADYFDPKSEKYAIIILNVAARWCGPCNQETDEIAGGIAAQYGPKKVVFVQAITEGLNYEPATLNDLNAWIGDHTNNFTTMLDPNQTNLGVFFDRAAIPFNAVIDARSMEILYAGTGAPQDFAGFLDKYLNLVKTIQPKP